MRRLIVVAAFVASSLVAAPALAVPGALDPTFSGDGKNLTNVTNGEDWIIDVALQPDGKVVAAGISNWDRYNPNLAVSRYNADGSLDTSFSSNGQVTTDFFRGIRDAANDVVVQPDGKILAAGISDVSRSGSDFAMVRYNPDGTIDDSFHADGRVTTNFTSQYDSIQQVVLLADGDIIAAGIAGNGSSNPKMALARYNIDGSLVGSFGVGGKVMTDFTPSWDGALAIALQPDAKIVVAGGAGDPKGRIALARYTLDGALDTTFSGDGKVKTEFTPYYDEALGMALQADGKIVVAGKAGWNGPNPRFAVARYLPTGALDPTFHSDGKVVTDFTTYADQANDVKIDADGRIIVVGDARIDRVNATFALARYNSNGSLDGSFGSAGRVQTNVTPRPDFAVGVELQVDGRIVVGGGAGFGRDCKFVVARYDAT